MNSIPHLILGDIITPTQAGQSLLIKKGYVLINGDSIIEVGEQAHFNKEISYTVSNYPDHLILPGLIDTHSHLSQYAICGAGDLPLMDWLNTLVFPLKPLSRVICKDANVTLSFICMLAWVLAQRLSIRW